MSLPKVSQNFILQSFLFETSTVKIAKVTNIYFWITLAQIGSFFNF